MKIHYSCWLLPLVLQGWAWAGAQAADPGVLPDCLHLGTVYPGSTVECSFMAKIKGNDAKTPFQVTAPKFVKVLSTKVHVQNFNEDYVCATVYLALDTTAPTELKGEITVTLGSERFKVPVSATVKPRRPGLLRTLIAGTPFHSYSTSDGKMFQAWTEQVDQAGLDVTYLQTERGKPVFRDLDLARFDVVLVGPDTLASWTPEDAGRVSAWAERGGRVVVTANYFFRGTVAGANLLLEKHGLKMLDVEAQGDAASATIPKEGLGGAGAQLGVNSLYFYRASPTIVTDAAKGKILVRAVGLPGGFVARAKAGKGEVVALGESLWCFWISPGQAKGADNAKFLRWLLTLSLD